MKVGSIAARTTTGTQAYTGVGFQPAVVLFYLNDLTADGSSTDAQFGFGAGISSSERACHAVFGQSGSTNAGRRQSNVGCVMLVNGAGTATLFADLDSMDADGFTLDFTTVTGTAHVINYVALDSSEVTSAKILQIAAKTTTGSQAYTGAGFQPDAVMIFQGMNTSAANGGVLGWGSIGFATGASNQGGIGFCLVHNNVTPQQVSISNTQIIRVAHFNNAANIYVAALTSLDADGFTLNWTTVGGAADIMFALCLEGPNFHVGSFAQKTSTGTQAITGTGFEPTGVLMFATNFTATNVDGSLTFAFGAASSSTARAGVNMSYTEGTNAGEVNLQQDKVILIHPDGTLASEADYVSNDSDGFTLDWTTADAVARLIPYLAIGTAPAPTAAITGTAGDGATEAEIVAGGETIIITLTNDTWVASGASFDAIRQDIIDGFDSAQSEANGWNAEVRDKEDVSAIVRTSDTVVTWTITAQAGFNITATETITGTIPGSAVTGASPITATPTFNVSAVGGGNAARSMYYHLVGGAR